jgi:hypothetical protein
MPVSIEQVRCRAAYAWSRSGLGESLWKVCLCCGLRSLLNAEQPLCLCHLSIRDAMSRLNTIVVAG